LSHHRIYKVLMDGGRLATSAKPPQFCIVSDSRHGRKEWFAGDDSFGTAADALASLLDPGINDGVSSCRPNTMDSRLSQSQIDRILRDAGRLGTSTKDAQLDIRRDSRHGRSPLCSVIVLKQNAYFIASPKRQIYTGTSR